jgi:Arc/MetJ family transcription regulator
MHGTKRATIYLDADLHRAARMKAVEIEKSVSDVVNSALRQSLAEDADDLATFRDRASEPSVDFEAFVKDLRHRGKL